MRQRRHAVARLVRCGAHALPGDSVVTDSCSVEFGMNGGDLVDPGLSLSNEKSVKWVSQQLGHRDASITLNTYAQALPDEETDLSYLPAPGTVTARHQGRHQTPFAQVRQVREIKW